MLRNVTDIFTLAKLMGHKGGSMASELIPAVCPECGGHLQETERYNKYKCMNCGKLFLLASEMSDIDERQRKIENLYKLANNARKNGNFSEAYESHSRILELDINNYKAWFGKGFYASFIFDDYRYFEGMSYFDNAFPVEEISKNYNDAQRVISEKYESTDKFNEIREYSFLSHKDLYLLTHDIVENVANNAEIIFHSDLRGEKKINELIQSFQEASYLSYMKLKLVVRMYRHYLPNEKILCKLEKEKIIQYVAKNISDYGKSEKLKFLFMRNNAPELIKPKEDPKYSFVIQLHAGINLPIELNLDSRIRSSIDSIIKSD